MVYLKKEEKDMLNGKFGEGVAWAMKIQVRLGECFDADKMVEVNKVHVSLSNQDADLWFVEKMVNGGAFCRVIPTVNPGFNIEIFNKQLNISEHDMFIMERTKRAYEKMGIIPTYSCTPYLEGNVPIYGQCVSYSETSVTVYANSIIGARTNRESVQSSLCAAITGRVPNYGYLLDENRKGNILVKVQAKIEDDFDYQLLGCCAKKIGFGVPVFTGLPLDPSQEALISLGAQLNTFGNYAMYHIVGVTPEARTLTEAFGGKEPSRVVTITDYDFDEIRQNICQPVKAVDFVMFGCPHFTIKQVQEVAKMVAGKKLATEMWILTSIGTKELADRMGLTKNIEEAGGIVVDQTCVDQPCWSHLKGKSGLTDSPKCAYYTKTRGMEFIVKDIKTCVNTALQGGKL